MIVPTNARNRSNSVSIEDISISKSARKYKIPVAKLLLIRTGATISPKFQKDVFWLNLMPLSRFFRETLLYVTNLLYVVYTTLEEESNHDTSHARRKNRHY